MQGYIRDGSPLCTFSLVRFFDVCQRNEHIKPKPKPDPLQRLPKHFIYGPSFEPLAEAIVREGLAPRIICESDGTQAEDARWMKQCWAAVKQGV